MFGTVLKKIHAEKKGTKFGGGGPWRLLFARGDFFCVFRDVKYPVEYNLLEGKTTQISIRGTVNDILEIDPLLISKGLVKNFSKFTVDSAESVYT